MINYIYDPFNSWYIFAHKYDDINLGLGAFLDIKQRLLIDKYILTIKKCEDILNGKDEIQKLHSIKFADSIIIVGNMIYDFYVLSLKDKSLRNKSIENIKKDTNRINEFLSTIYSDYRTLTDTDLKKIIKEYK